MANKKKVEESQGEIIDELRKIRAQVGRKFRSNPEQFFADSQKLMKKLGICYGTPKKRSPGNDEDAA